MVVHPKRSDSLAPDTALPDAEAAELSLERLLASGSVSQFDAEIGPAAIAAPLHDLAEQPAAVLRLDVFDDLAAAEADWRALEATGAATVFQSFDRLVKWQRHIGAVSGVAPAIVIGYSGVVPHFVFPLAIERRGGARRLTWLGSHLSDYNAPLLSPAFASQAGESFEHLWSRILTRLRAEPRHRFDIVDLPKMPETVAGIANPFMQLAVRRNPSNAYIAELGTDWESYYAGRRSAATRKKERQQLRQLGEHGEVRFVEAADPEDAARTVDVLIRQKSAALTKMGVASFLTRPGCRDFLVDIVADPALRSVVHVSRLEVGDVLAAASVGLQTSDCYYLVLSSYQEGMLSRFGPGRIHLNHLLRRAVGQGLRRFDFTIGNETYKLDWSDRESPLYDLLVPVTPLGRVIVAAELRFRMAKRAIKRNQRLWEMFRRSRAWLGSRWLQARDGPKAEAGRL
jgi:CelD/BcsL family acetyltransferase involved in cellulose biosynthesis